MNSKNNERRQWLDKRRNLFNFMFWSIEALIIIMLLLLWDSISAILGIVDSPLAEIITFLFIAGILTTINEYVHSRKGSELEMYYNIDQIRECIEKNTNYQKEILALLLKIEQSKNHSSETSAQHEAQNQTQNEKEVSPNNQNDNKADTYNSDPYGDYNENSHDEDVPDWYKSIPPIIETPLQNAEYKTKSRFPLDFDPIDYLREQNANSDILETYAARRAIRRWYKECSEYITEYADYSSLRTERRQETVKVEDHKVKIIIEISSEDGVIYQIKITFTLEE